MIHLIHHQSLTAIIRHWASGVSILFMAVLLVGAVGQLGHALGGNIIAYGEALVIVVAMTVLVLNVVLSRSEAVQSQSVADQSQSVRRAA